MQCIRHPLLRLVMPGNRPQTAMSGGRGVGAACPSRGSDLHGASNIRVDVRPCIRRAALPPTPTPTSTPPWPQPRAPRRYAPQNPSRRIRGSWTIAPLRLRHPPRTPLLAAGTLQSPGAAVPHHPPGSSNPFHLLGPHRQCPNPRTRRASAGLARARQHPGTRIGTGRKMSGQAASEGVTPQHPA